MAALVERASLARPWRSVIPITDTDFKIAGDIVLESQRALQLVSSIGAIQSVDNAKAFVTYHPAYHGLAPRLSRAWAAT